MLFSLKYLAGQNMSLTYIFHALKPLLIRWAHVPILVLLWPWGQVPYVSKLSDKQVPWVVFTSNVSNKVYILRVLNWSAYLKSFDVTVSMNPPRKTNKIKHKSTIVDFLMCDIVPGYLRVKLNKINQTWTWTYLGYRLYHRLCTNSRIYNTEKCRHIQAISQNDLCFMNHDTVLDNFTSRKMTGFLTLHIWQLGFVALVSHGQSWSHSLQNCNKN